MWPRRAARTRTSSPMSWPPTRCPALKPLPDLPAHAHAPGSALLAASAWGACFWGPSAQCMFQAQVPWVRFTETIDPIHISRNPLLQGGHAGSGRGRGQVPQVGLQLLREDARVFACYSAMADTIYHAEVYHSSILQGLCCPACASSDAAHAHL